MARDRRVEVYQDTAGEWRWKLIAGNGETLAESSEGYVDRQYAIDQAIELNPDVVTHAY